MINNGIKLSTSTVLYPVSRNLKILVMKLDHMGDFILALPALMRLRTKFAGAEIDIIVGDWNLSLAKKAGIFNNIYTLNYFNSKSTVSPCINWGELNELLDKLTIYDIAIDLRRPPDTRFILCRVPAKMKCGYRTHSTLDNELDVCLDTDLDKPFVAINAN